MLENRKIAKHLGTKCPESLRGSAGRLLCDMNRVLGPGSVCHPHLCGDLSPLVKHPTACREWPQESGPSGAIGHPRGCGLKQFPEADPLIQAACPRRRPWVQMRLNRRRPGRDSQVCVPGTLSFGHNRSTSACGRQKDDANAQHGCRRGCQVRLTLSELFPGPRCAGTSLRGFSRTSSRCSNYERVEVATGNAGRYSPSAE